MSAASSVHLANPSSSLSSPSPCPSSSPSRSPVPMPPLSSRPPPPRPLFTAASPPSSSPSSSTEFDHHQNMKHQQQIQSSFRRAIQLIGPPKEQRESADTKNERETNTEQQQGTKMRQKMPSLPSLPAVVPRSSSSSSSSPLCAPMDPLSQLVASFAAAAHHNQQQQQRNASLPCGPPPPVPPVPSFLPNGAQLVPAGPFLSSAHPPPTDFNALLAIAPPGVLGPFMAGGVANASFIPPPPEMLFAATQHPHNHHHQSINGTTNANNGIANNGASAMPPGIPPGTFPFPLDPVVLATFQPYMVPPEARRKNATREVTAPLKHWLNGHRKNPYPTKAEKTYLAVLTNMTMTQVSTWFANARRRLKKENKMTWSPRNRPNDEDDFYEPDEGTTATANGAEGPSSPELEEEQEEEQNGHRQQNANGAMEQQQQKRQRRGIWSIADTLGEDGQGEGHNAKLKQQKEEPGGEDERKDSRRTEGQLSCEEVKQENKSEQQQDEQQQNKFEQSLHEQQQRMDSPRSGQSVHCAANALPRSPHPPPPGPHAAPSPLDFLIGSPPMPSAHPMLLPFSPTDLQNARHNLLFALQHQNQLHHQRSLMAAANPMMTAMFLAQHFAAHQQQMGGMAEGGKQMDGTAKGQTAAEHQCKGMEDQQQQERNNALI